MSDAHAKSSRMEAGEIALSSSHSAVVAAFDKSSCSRRQIAMDLGKNSKKEPGGHKYRALF